MAWFRCGNEINSSSDIICSYYDGSSNTSIGTTFLVEANKTYTVFMNWWISTGYKSFLFDGADLYANTSSTINANNGKITEFKNVGGGGTKRAISFKFTPNITGTISFNAYYYNEPNYRETALFVVQ